MSNNISVGKINGNPLCGLCEKVCVELKTITDGCRSVYDNEQVQVTLSNFSSEPSYPLTFNSLFFNGLASLSGLVVEPTENAKSRIRYTATFTASVSLISSDGSLITANGELSFYQDVLLSIPTDPFSPYSVEVAGIVRSRVGSVITQNVANVRLCATIVTRITQLRELVIPTYGDCVYPRCREFTQICGGVQDTPAFIDNNN